MNRYVESILGKCSRCGLARTEHFGPEERCERPPNRAAGDQKIATAASKVPLNLLPLRALKGVARVFGYGAKKYAAGNFHTASDAEIANRYVGGFLRHLADAQRPDGLFDWASLGALDVESGLPEIDHALCGLIMLRSLAIKHGALPADPGVGNEPVSVASLLAAARVAAGSFDVLELEPIRAPGDPGYRSCQRKETP